MNSPEIKEFIYQHSSLFWYTPEDKKGDISHEYLIQPVPDEEIRSFLLDKSTDIWEQ